MATTTVGEEEGLADQHTPGWRERIKTSAMWGTVACGAGLFSDGYINASIGPVNTMLKHIYGKPYSGSKKITNVSAIAFAGTVVGQLFFGFTSDHWSRKGSLLVSSAILIVFAILSAGAWGKNLEIFINTLIAFRFFVGIGIGGEYPAGSVGAAENSGNLKKGTRNRWFIMFTNVMIDLGWVLAYLVAMIVVLATTENHLKAAWRIVLGIGAFTPVSLFFLRTLISEPEPFTHEKMTVKDTPWLLAIRFYWWRLLLVAIIWFIYDFCAYSFGNFSSVLIDNLFATHGGLDTAGNQQLWVVFGWSTLLNFFYMPGALAGSFLADSFIGPKYTLILGTALQCIVGFGIAGGIHTLYEVKNVAGFCILYGLFLAFGELGPGDCIGLFASKTCSTSIRGKYYGIAAAIGKVGAFTGQYAFVDVGKIGNAKNDAVLSVQYQFWLGGGLALLSCLIALLLPNIDQDVVAEEDIRFRRYLEDHGYDTSLMGIGNVAPEPYPNGSEAAEKVDAQPEKTY